MLNAGVSRVDISPVAGVAHAGWGAQTHQVSLGNDMPSLVTALSGVQIPPGVPRTIQTEEALAEMQGLFG